MQPIATDANRLNCCTVREHKVSVGVHCNNYITCAVTTELSGTSTDVTKERTSKDHSNHSVVSHELPTGHQSVPSVVILSRES